MPNLPQRTKKIPATRDEICAEFAGSKKKSHYEITSNGGFIYFKENK